MVKDIAELPRRITEAFEIATTGCPGLVLVDLPKDITAGILKKPIPTQYTLPFRAFSSDPIQLSSSSTIDPIIQRAAALINGAEKPVIYAGQGILATDEGPTRLRDLAARGNIPVTTTLQGLGAFDELNPRSLHMLGMHESAGLGWMGGYPLCVRCGQILVIASFFFIYCFFNHYTHLLTSDYYIRITAKDTMTSRHFGTK